MAGLADRQAGSAGENRGERHPRLLGAPSRSQPLENEWGFNQFLANHGVK